MANSSCVKDYSLLDRASPPVLAKHCKNQVKRGNDGNLWKSKKCSNNVYRWVRHSDTSPKPGYPGYVLPRSQRPFVSYGLSGSPSSKPEHYPNQTKFGRDEELWKSVPENGRFVWKKATSQPTQPTQPTNLESLDLDTKLKNQQTPVSASLESLYLDDLEPKRRPKRTNRRHIDALMLETKPGLSRSSDIYYDLKLRKSHNVKKWQMYFGSNEIVVEINYKGGLLLTPSPHVIKYPIKYTSAHANWSMILCSEYDQRVVAVTNLAANELIRLKHKDLDKTEGFKLEEKKSIVFTDAKLHKRSENANYEIELIDDLMYFYYITTKTGKTLFLISTTEKFDHIINFLSTKFIDLQAYD